MSITAAEHDIEMIEKTLLHVGIREDYTRKSILCRYIPLDYIITVQKFDFTCVNIQKFFSITRYTNETLYMFQAGGKRWIKNFMIKSQSVDVLIIFIYFSFRIFVLIICILYLRHGFIILFNYFNCFLSYNRSISVCIFATPLAWLQQANATFWLCL